MLAPHGVSESFSHSLSAVLVRAGPVTHENHAGVAMSDGLLLPGVGCVGLSPSQGLGFKEWVQSSGTAPFSVTGLS